MYQLYTQMTQSGLNIALPECGEHKSAFCILGITLVLKLFVTTEDLLPTFLIITPLSHFPPKKDKHLLVLAS